mmetsp:Transcript_1534/g.2700  ORF Transcript_1534/g.2700 Transcript_1534/m.2700 type:complete len:268 (+) Transcript_1534:150-953(+)
MSVENMTKLSEKQHFSPTPFGAASNDSDTGSGSLVIGEGPKRYFAPSYGVPDVYKSTCRQVEPVCRSNAPTFHRPHPQERDVQFTSFSRDRDRRHLTDRDLPCVMNPKDRELNWTTKKTVLFGDQNQPRHSFKSEEYAIETKFNRKQRVSDSDMGKKRNYISVASLGDKSYKFADREPGFYKEGGLVVGSSIVQRTKTSSVPNKACVGSTGSLKSLTAHEKRELETINNDMSSIETLTNSYYKRGQQQPSWEEKTGMWLCRPEDEND